MSDVTRGDYRLVPTDLPSEYQPTYAAYPDTAGQPLQYNVDGAPVVQYTSQGVPIEPPQPQGCRARGQALLHNTCFQCMEAALIVGNAIVIGLETDIRWYEHWDDIENGFLLVFLLELIFKIVVIGKAYFNWEDADFQWNIFDIFIVGLGCFDAGSQMLHPEKKAGGGFATLFRMIRLLRILRIFRIVKFLKELYVLAFGLVEAVKAVFWVTILMFFVLYVCSIVLVKTIGSPPPDDRNYDFLVFHYGSIIESMLTLFVLMSSPNFYIYQDEEGLLEDHVPFIIFLIIFITIGSFGMIALLTGVINESMFQKNEVRMEQKRIEQEDMKSLITYRCADMYETVVVNGAVEVTVQQAKHLASQLCEMLAECGIQFSRDDMVRIIEFMDNDGTGLIELDEFVSTMLKIADGLGPLSIQELQNQLGIVQRKVDTVQTTLNTHVESMQSQMAMISQQISDLSSTVQGRAITEATSLKAQVSAPAGTVLGMRPAR